MQLVQLTNPTRTPVSLSEARAQCSLFDETSHDPLLLRYIKEATKEAEDFLNGIIMQRTMCLYMDGFQSTQIDLKTYPVISVTSIKYDDEDDAEQTVSTSDYWVSTHGMSPFVKATEYWPATYLDKPNRVRITFEAGYADADDVPDDVRALILLRVFEKFENRSTEMKPDMSIAYGQRRISV